MRNENEINEEGSIERITLTHRQHTVLSFIERFVALKGFPPTIREIGKGLRIRSTNGVSDHLIALEKKGYISRLNYQSRSVQILKNSRNTANKRELKNEPLSENYAPIDDDRCKVSFFGDLSKLRPCLSERDAERALLFPKNLLPKKVRSPIFACETSCNSMIEDGIHPGSMIFFVEETTMTPGDRVIVHVNHEILVRRFFPEENYVRLQPANKKSDPLFVDWDSFHPSDILGTVICVLRTFEKTFG